MSQSPPPSNAGALPATEPTAPAISADALAAAAERRTRELPAQKSAAQLAKEHERKQKFRRMIDPGITRPNNKEDTISSLNTVLKIAENLLNDLDNPKYQQFKPTNTVIQRELVKRKGVLEYVIEARPLQLLSVFVRYTETCSPLQLGFRAEVENFQPYYRWNKRHLEELKVGTEVLLEFVDLYKQKEAQTTVSKVSQKEVQAQIAERVRLQFMEDRKRKAERDEMERQVRDARALSSPPADGPARVRLTRPTTAELDMPGEGSMLVSPPPYTPPTDESRVSQGVDSD